MDFQFQAILSVEQFDLFNLIFTKWLVTVKFIIGIQISINTLRQIIVFNYLIIVIDLSNW
jgi:hypothetical protein